MQAWDMGWPELPRIAVEVDEACVQVVWEC